jgi:hypothetical protein
LHLVSFFKKIEIYLASRGGFWNSKKSDLILESSEQEVSSSKVYMDKQFSKQHTSPNIHGKNHEHFVHYNEYNDRLIWLIYQKGA